MGKKKGFVYYNSKAKDKKKKKNKKKEYDIPKFKMVQPSLGRKDAKIAKKIVLAPVDVPKAFLKVRRKCNHAGKLITAAEFKEMTPAYAAEMGAGFYARHATQAVDIAKEVLGAGA